MANKKIKFTGVIKRFAGKSGGEEILIGKVKTDDSKKLLELATAKEKNKERVQGTMELIQEQLPGTGQQ